MLPSLLARDIQKGLQQFLVTGFEPTDSFFRGLMSRFVRDEMSWMRGPFLQLGLPFRIGRAGTKFFSTFDLPFTGWTHQEAAWQRLASDRDAACTLVATGTGSGKTECFLYPVLDHCARTRKDGVKGIKALIIYPMNALATDQAKRFAGAVDQIAAFKGLRVGMYVGGQKRGATGGMMMTPTDVITDRDTLRKNPPDVLLTNYKMLDYLLIRPRDRALWERNDPNTLRYLVVDELHTFDGAQGTDLALLLRRLFARLGTPAGCPICVGTSATLGSAADTGPLREYARQVFNLPFAPDSVVTENRLSAAEFLGDAAIEHLLQPRADLAAVLGPARYASPREAVAAWFAVFFPDVEAPADVEDPAWRQRLGVLLKSHLLFVNLLKLMRGGVVAIADLEQQMLGPLPQAAREHIREVLDALLVLVAWARDAANPRIPFITLRVQLWVRELRRMVARVAAKPDDVYLRTAADLKSQPDGLYLPLIQCSECHTTGWLSRIAPASNKASRKLEEIYNHWFSGSPEVVRLYATREIRQPQVAGVEQLLCTSCGNLQSRGEQCQACGHSELVPVFRTTGTRTGTRGALTHAWHDNTCPACGGRDRLILLGARNATLGAQVVEQGWSSPFNDDKKLIAFSDSVQDAAHRAGFFAARTYANTVRSGLAKAIDYLAAPVAPWSAFLDELAVLWQKPGSPLHMAADRFVSEFIGPNMTWQRDWCEALQKSGALPSGSRLPERVSKRLVWQAFSEFTYLSHRGRNLERIGKATLAPPAPVVGQAASALVPMLKEHCGISVSDQTVLFQWLWGFLTLLRKRGAVWHAEMAGYVQDGKLYGLNFLQGRSEWMPNMGPRGPRPLLLTLGNHREFDRLSSSRSETWYERWATVNLSRLGLLPKGVLEPAYLLAIAELERHGLLLRLPSPLGDAIALAPDQLELDTRVSFLETPQGKRHLAVPSGVAASLVGMPCLDDLGECFASVVSGDSWLAERFTRGDIKRVIAAEHTGLLERDEREALESRFKSPDPKPWFENLLSATPTLEMGVDIGDLSSVLLCSVPPSQASFLQRVGRAGRRDGNAMATTLADGSSPHDLYFFEEPKEMMAGEVMPPGVFLRAAEVLRRQLFAFCLDHWVGSGVPLTALPEKTSAALDAVENNDPTRFPYTFLDHVLTKEPELLQGFFALLHGDIDDGVRDRLAEYLAGAGEEDGLRLRLLKLLEDLVEERKGHRKRAEQIKSRIATLKAQPQDEATKNDIEQLDRERQTALELAREINQRELLNALTDAGLIPNYAFPEAGIELKSVLWRRRASDNPTSSPYVALGSIKYERPAASALSEFAPENRFYANQRRVEVDQINMGLAKLESWRLCPSCQHMENLERTPDDHAACPRCGDPMWGNQAQRRQLLRFKQALANSDDTKVRIDDSADDREPRFYLRQLLADFDAADVREAWQLKMPDLPFGFEFIARASFRDVNFGELSRPGDSFRVADREAVRPGFRLCRHCGKVQVPPKRNDSNGSVQQHAFDCGQREANDPANVIECLYLYREFSSEALRILVPYTRSGVDEEVVQSFIAALQLGLKKRFGGRVDHLRLMTQDEPSKNDGPRRQYVMLYDSVPGGTGYLHQLLAKDAKTLADVLRLALETIVQCSCNADPAKDGCYRCVYQYRQGRMMPVVSRDRAREVLTELCASLDQLERVETIADIFINPNFDSALEARFIESLRRLGGQHGLPAVKLVQEIVNGKSGYLLEVGSDRYWIEPQVEVGPNDGVRAHCKPDFVIRPVKALAKRRAIAMFCDGWAYHRDALRADAKKRSAVVASGRYWIWSVGHEDVKRALLREADIEIESPLTALNRHDGTSAPASLLRAEPRAFTRNAVAQLLNFLAQPVTEEDDSGVLQLQRNAAWATFLMVPKPGSAEFNNVTDEVAARWAGLPDWMQEVPNPNAPCCSRVGAEPRVFGYWPAAFARGEFSGPVPGLLLLDDEGGVEDSVRYAQWRVWTHLFNTLQTLPGQLMTTSSGLVANDYADLAPADGAALPGSEQGVAHAQAWDVAVAQAVAEVQAGMRILAERGCSPPDEIGLELANDAGEVCAEAELVWSTKKVVVLVLAQAEHEPAWRAAGWRVVAAHDGWHEEVATALASH